MVNRTFLRVLTTTLLFLEYCRKSCDGFPNSFMEMGLKKLLPFDPTPGFAAMKTLPYLNSKLEKLGQLKGSPFTALMADTRAFMKESVFPSNYIDEKEISLHHLPRSGKKIPLSLKEIATTEGKLFFIVHGWLEDISDAKWHEKLSHTLANHFKESEVVVLDWGSSSNKYLYPLAASRTKAVGYWMAKKLIELVDTHKYPKENIVLIGYDLGAHVCGHAGQFYAQTAKSKLPLIIGLDPSGPLFEGKNPEERLDESDAETVMVVHTGSDLVGYASQCGTIDFYPNGGKTQPGCESENLFCNHHRSFELFTAAIPLPENFPTKKCNSSEEYEASKCEKSDVVFGNIFETRRGQYFFDTTDKPPFYKTFMSYWNPVNWF